MLPLLVALLLGASALIFVFYPLYSQKRISSAAPISHSLTPQEEREQSARTTLQEVEFDFQLGNLAENDYLSLRDRYTRRAYLASKPRNRHEQEIDEAIEEQLRQLKQQNEHTDEKIEEE